MRHDCYFCHTKTIKKLIEKFKPEDDKAEEFAYTINKILLENWNQPNPYISTQIHRNAKLALGKEDLFQEEKFKANKTLLASYDRWKALVNNSENPLHLAAKLSVVGNIIDYGAHSAPEDIEKCVEELLKLNLKIDHSKELFKRIKEADSILYLGDNAGEIVFDKLFIETMNHKGITYAVRGKPVINDVTFEDVRQTRISDFCTIISNGYDAPSTLLELCSKEFIDAFNKVDLIISKGQGNFEGLMNEKRDNIFFLFIAKCKLMADMAGVNKNDLVITNLNSKIDGI